MLLLFFVFPWLRYIEPIKKKLPCFLNQVIFRKLNDFSGIPLTMPTWVSLTNLVRQLVIVDKGKRDEQKILESAIISKPSFNTVRCFRIEVFFVTVVTRFYGFGGTLSFPLRFWP